MGSATIQAYRILFTATNVRLGVWLPHPAVVRDARLLLDALPHIRLVGIDRDPVAVAALLTADTQAPTQAQRISAVRALTVRERTA